MQGCSRRRNDLPIRTSRRQAPQTAAPAAGVVTARNVNRGANSAVLFAADRLDTAGHAWRRPPPQSDGFGTDAERRTNVRGRSPMDDITREPLQIRAEDINPRFNWGRALPALGIMG